MLASEEEPICFISVRSNTWQLREGGRASRVQSILVEGLLARTPLLLVVCRLCEFVVYAVTK